MRVMNIGIGTKLIVILFFLGLIPLLFVGFLAYETASEALLFQAREQLGNITAKTARQIDDFFIEMEKDIELLAEYPFVQLAFLQHEFGQKLDRVQQVLTDYREKNNFFTDIFLLDMEGQPIISGIDRDRAIKPDLSPEWFEKALSRGTLLSDLKVSGISKTPRMLLSRPVHDFEERTRTVGLLVFDIKVSSFTQFVSSLDLGEKGYAFLWDHQGHIIYHPNSSYRFNADISLKGDTDFRRLLETMSRGEKGFGDYTFNGKGKNMFFSPCSTRPWSVGIALERSKLMADILKLRRSMISFSSIIAFLILMAALLFVRSITRPINRLIEGARAIGHGDLDHKITVDSKDEFARLAGEFNNMSEKLRHSMKEIIDLKTFNDDILRSVSSGIITVDRQNRITSFNPVAGDMLGLENPSGSPGARAQVEEVKTLLDQTLTGKIPPGGTELDINNVTDERHVFLEINTSLFRNSASEVIGAIADIRDITRRKQIEDEMLRVEKLASLGELSAGMAHEIRNPLAGMKTSAQVLKKRLHAEEEKSLIDGIIDSINRMNRTVADLLNFSRPKPSHPAPWDLPSLMDQTLSMLRVKLKKSRIELVLDYGEAMPLAFIDREQLQQVFINLLLNSVKAMPNGGRLTVSVKQSAEPGFLEIAITDTGVGIKKEMMPKIFNPFFTADPRGTGLGLSIVQKLLEKNNGYIRIDSVPDRGTQASVLVPAASQE